MTEEEIHVTYLISYGLLDETLKEFITKLGINEICNESLKLQCLGITTRD